MEISGSKLICSSPELIAAYHVLHRLLVPRHPPYALCSLTIFFHRAWPRSKRPDISETPTYSLTLVSRLAAPRPSRGRYETRCFENLFCVFQRSKIGFTTWTLAGSNRRPPACKAGALPAELRALNFCRPIGVPSSRTRPIPSS